MATTATTFNPAPTRTPFISQGIDLVGTPVPRAELRFAIVGDEITAAASGESQSCLVVCSLPKGYAYYFMGCEIDLLETEAGDVVGWNADWRTYLLSSDTTGALRSLSGIKCTGCVPYYWSAALKGRIYQAAPIQRIIIPVYDTGAKYQCQNVNVALDGGPVTTYFTATFLQFDLNQAFHYALNTPQPVR